MSELTNELRDEANGARAFGERGHAALLDLAADRIDALEECLLNIADARPSTWEEDVRDQFQAWAQNKARDLLEGK